MGEVDVLHLRDSGDKEITWLDRAGSGSSAVAAPWGAYQGIDTIAVRGTLPPAVARSLRSETGRAAERNVGWETGEVTKETLRLVMPSGARLTVVQRGDQPPTATVEASVPKLLRGTNFEPSPVAEATAAVAALYEEAASKVSWEQPVDKLHVMRVDATGNFQDVSDKDRILRALAEVKVKRNPRISLRADPQHGGAMTLSRGPGRYWKLTAYDKGAEVASRASRRAEDDEAIRRDIARSADVLRVELMLRRPRLVDLGIDTVGDLSDDLLAAEHRRKFEEMGFGRVVTGLGALAHAARAANDLSAQSRATMLGVVLQDLLGVPTDLKRDTNKKHRDMAARFGIVATTLLTGTYDARLDYASARQVRVDRAPDAPPRGCQTGSS